MPKFLVNSLCRYRLRRAGGPAFPTSQLMDKVPQSARIFCGADVFKDDVCLLAIDIADGKKA
ncbi:MAG TPA: hypothetical protein VGJ73_02715 [Verrucomicrobiae bacterium]